MILLISEDVGISYQIATKTTKRASRFLSPLCPQGNATAKTDMAFNRQFSAAHTDAEMLIGSD